MNKLGARALRLVTAVVATAGTAFLSTGVIGAPPASASAPVVYTADVTIPAPPSSNFSGASAGGDGWAVGFTTTQVFNVFHHNSSALEVNCHNQSDASACWTGPKTITDTSGNSFSTSGQPGLTVNQTTGHLFVMATRLSDHTSGAVCIDTTQPASTADPFCGFTALSAVGGAPLDNGISGVTDPVVVGAKWYAFNEVPGTPTATEDEMLCFDLSTDTACAGQPYTVSYGTGTVSTTEPAPGIAAVGTDVILQVPTSAGNQLTCFDTTTDATCTGSWPVAISSTDGAPYPMLSTTGTPTGVCLPTGADPCYDLTGASVATPAGMTTTIPAVATWNGPSVTIGARVYVPNGSYNQVDCYDYSTSATCANFPKSFSNLSLLYTVNADFQRPTCLWVNSDSGADQIQNFDAYTGGSCGNAPLRVLSSSVVAPVQECVPSSWTSLQVVSPVPSAYTSGTVDFQDSNGAAIPGVATHNLDSTGTADLTDLNLSTQYALPQFVITLTGLSGSPGSVQVKLTWSGTYSPSCVTPTTTVPTATDPGPPTGVGVTGGTHSATVSWSPPGTDGFSPITGYTATAYDSNGNPAGSCTAPATATSCTITGLTDGAVYTFKVVATNAVGSAGTSGTPALAGTAVPVPTAGATAATPGGLGYWALAGDGTLTNQGNAANDGSENGAHLNAPIVAINSTMTGLGYWLVGSDGGVFAFGDAGFHGSMAGSPLNQPIVGIARTPDSAGYWLVAADGGVFAFGDAGFHGSMAGSPLNQPIVGIASTPDGKGYWLVAADGGVFGFGDAGFYGSMGGLNLNKHIVGITSPPDGLGYWLVAADGGVFNFGDAPFYGSLGAAGTIPVAGLIANSTLGYRLITPQGAAYPFGTTP